MQERGTIAVLALMLWVAPGPEAALRAQTPDGGGSPSRPGTGWEVGGFGGLVDDRPEFEIAGGEFRVSHSPAGGGRFGYGFPSGLFVQTDLVFAPVDLRVRNGSNPFLEPLDALIFSASVGQNVSPASWLQLFARGGAGGVRWNAEAGSEIDVLLHGGGGLRLFPVSRMAFRGDVRWHLAPSALEETRRELRSDLEPAGETLWLPEITAGISVFLGGER